MSFTIELTNHIENNLLNRKELTFELSHSRSAIPNKQEVAAKLASLNQTNVKNVVVYGITCGFGSNKSIGKAKVYKTFEQLDLIERDFVVERLTGEKKKKKIGRKVRKVMRKKKALMFGSLRRNMKKQKRKEAKGS